MLARHRGTVRCFAVTGSECTAAVAPGALRQLLPDGVRRQWDAFTRAANLGRSDGRALGVRLCPFCGAEAAGPCSAIALARDRWPHLAALAVLSMVLLVLPVCCAAALLAAPLWWRCALPAISPALPWAALPWVVGPTSEPAAVVGWVVWALLLRSCWPTLRAMHRRGAERHFWLWQRCANPDCSVLSCSRCRGEAHLCGCFAEVPAECSEEALRSYVALAMDSATVRVCPACGLQFCKQDGCNKMACSCGFALCYVCRAPVEDYSHFCQHFRPDAGRRCPQCRKCDLYKSDDSPTVIRAAEHALRTYLAKHRGLRGTLSSSLAIHGVSLRVPAAD